MNTGENQWLFLDLTPFWQLPNLVIYFLLKGVN
jgi:hypothetical protein